MKIEEAVAQLRGFIHGYSKACEAWQRSQRLRGRGVFHTNPREIAEAEESYGLKTKMFAAVEALFAAWKQFSQSEQEQIFSFLTSSEQESLLQGINYAKHTLCLE